MEKPGALGGHGQGGPDNVPDGGMQHLMNVNLMYGVAGLMVLALSAYAVLGIADFGGGVWDLFAAGPRARQQRKAVATAMGPVWESNHVWLIFFVIMLFTAFPAGFSMLSVALFVPLNLVLLGIILRGAAFVFRSPEATTAVSGPERAWSVVFGVASTVTPLLLGAAVGAVSSGGIRIDGVGGGMSLAGEPGRISGAGTEMGYIVALPADSWLSPLAISTGIFVLSLAAYLAAVYLAAETTGELREDFHRRAVASGTWTALMAMLMLWALSRYAPWLWDRFAHEAGGAVLALGAAMMLLSFYFVVRRRYFAARVTAAGQIVLYLWGWAFAQWPYIIYPGLTFHDARAPDGTLRFMLQIIPLGMLLLIPSLWFLFKVFKGRRPEREE